MTTARLSEIGAAWAAAFDAEASQRVSALTEGAYLAGAPTEPELPQSEPTGWPSGVSVSWPRQQGRATQ